MKKLIEFFKNTTIAGLVILVPIAIIIVLLSDTVKKLIVATTPITSKLAFGGPITETIIALLFVAIIITLTLFIAGLLLKSYLGKNFTSWLEKNILEKIPMYSTIKGITSQFAGVEKSNYPVVEVDLYGTNNRVLGLMTDTLDDGRHLVYVPLSPIANIGQLHLVSDDNVKITDLPVTDAMDTITRMGFEAHKSFKKKE
jgi:uncharacterized membrane protein